MISARPLFGYLAYHKITRKELSEKTGISMLTLTKMYQNDFTLKTVDRICTCLNLEIKDVLRYEEAQDI